MFANMPRPVLVFLVLTLGVAGIIFFQEPHSVCDSQEEVVRESLKGKLFAKNDGKTKTPSHYPRYFQNCKMANSAGGCYEYFQILRAIVRDLNGSPEECLAPFGQIKEIGTALEDGMTLMAQIAWGNFPPESMNRFGWLETLELGLFCKLKATYIKTYGAEELENLRARINHKIPGEAPILQDGVCTNCETRKAADQVFSREELWVRSLFSVRCEQYQ